MEKGLTAKHKKFIELVASGETIVAAYLATNSNRKQTNATARANGCKLAKKYAKQIELAKEKLSKAISQARESEVVETALKSILSVAEVDAKISSIISGEFQIEEYAYSDGARFKTHRSPNAMEVKGAADLYYKRFGNYTAERIEIKNIGEAPVTSLKIRKRSEK